MPGEDRQCYMSSPKRSIVRLLVKNTGDNMNVFEPRLLSRGLIAHQSTIRTNVV